MRYIDIKRLLIITMISFMVLLSFYFIYNTGDEKRAFVNSIQVRVSSSIDGKLHLHNDLHFGKYVNKGEVLGIVRANVGDSNYVNILLQIESLEKDLKTLSIKLDAKKKNKLNTIKRISESRDVLKAQQDVDRININSEIKLREIDLIIAKDNLNMSEFELNRMKSLVKQGVYTSNSLKEYVNNLNNAKNSVVKVQKDIQRLKDSKNYNDFGVTTNSMRNLSTADLRIKDMNKDLEDSEIEIVATTKEIEILENRLKNLIDIKNKIEVYEIIAPVDGYIHNINNNTGSSLHSGDDVLSIIECNNINVVGFFSDKVAEKLFKNQYLDISIGEIKITGRVRGIEHGVGRVELGNYMVTPPTEILRRELPVKISIVDISLDESLGKEELKKQDMCGVGKEATIYITQ